MLVDIKNNDYLPEGRYALMNPEKIERAKSSLPSGSNERSLLIEYDKIGGLIIDVLRDKKIPVHTFWDIEKQKMNDSLENLSDVDLLAIIRKVENTTVSGSQYQKANAEWQIRHQQRLLEAAKSSHSGVSFGVGGDMINDGIIQTGTGARVDITVAGNYVSKEGKIIQKSDRLKHAWWKRPEIIISIIIGLISIPWWPKWYQVISESRSAGVILPVSSQIEE